MTEEGFIEIYKIKDDYLLGTSKGEWVIKFGSDIKRLNQINFTTLLPVLENKYLFVSKFKEAIEDGRLSKSLLESFPFEELIVAAYEIKSNYWFNLSLDWIKDEPISTKLLEILRAGQFDNWIDQKLRHKSKKTYFNKKKK